ncbi:MAG: type III-A CRISPR-associated protein Csm2 [Candidatus Heimdallarchaeaceae archaeon]
MSTYKKHQSKPRGSYSKGSFPKKQDNIKFFKEKMAKKEYWAKYDVSEFAPKDGDAYKIATAFKIESKNTSKNRSSQLRKFYDGVLKTKIKLQLGKEEKINEALASILMIVPRAHYARHRNLITDAVIDFLSTAIDKKKFRTDNIKHFTEDFDRFLKFFESVIGYNYLLKGD